MKTSEKNLTVLPVLNEAAQSGWGEATDEQARADARPTVIANGPTTVLFWVLTAKSPLCYSHTVHTLFTIE